MRVLIRLTAPLRRIELAFDLPAYDVSIWWHPRTHANPKMRWVRAELIKMVNERAV